MLALCEIPRLALSGRAELFGVIEDPSELTVSGASVQAEAGPHHGNKDIKGSPAGGLDLAIGW